MNNISRKRDGRGDGGIGRDKKERKKGGGIGRYLINNTRSGYLEIIDNITEKR